MNVTKLRDRCNELIKEGYGHVNVSFDTEALCFHIHIVKIKDIYSIGKEVEEAIGEKVVTITFDTKEYKEHLSYTK